MNPSPLTLHPLSRLSLIEPARHSPSHLSLSLTLLCHVLESALPCADASWRVRRAGGAARGGHAGHLLAPPPVPPPLPHHMAGHPQAPSLPSTPQLLLPPTPPSRTACKSLAAERKRVHARVHVQGREWYCHFKQSPPPPSQLSISLTPVALTTSQARGACVRCSPPPRGPLLPLPLPSCPAPPAAAAPPPPPRASREQLTSTAPAAAPGASARARRRRRGGRGACRSGARPSAARRGTRARRC